MPSASTSAEKTSTPAKDRFDDLPATPGRTGAHRAEQPRLRPGTIVLWSVLATVLIVVVGVVGSMVATGRIGFGPSAAPSSDSGVVAPQVDTSYPVLVLNATDEQGLGATIRDEIITAGWAESTVEESNASSTDFPTTTVYYGAEADEAAARGLADVLGGAAVELDDTYQVVPPPGTATVDGQEGSQLVVIVGLDFRTR